MGTCFAGTLLNGIFDAANAQKNDKLLFCVGSGETALRARQGEIFEESASHHVHPHLSSLLPLVAGGSAQHSLPPPKCDELSLRSKEMSRNLVRVVGNRIGRLKTTRMQLSHVSWKESIQRCLTSRRFRRNFFGHKECLEDAKVWENEPTEEGVQRTLNFSTTNNKLSDSGSRKRGVSTNGQNVWFSQTNITCKCFVILGQIFDTTKCEVRRRNVWSNASVDFESKMQNKPGLDFS